MSVDQIGVYACALEDHKPQNHKVPIFVSGSYFAFADFGFSIKFNEKASLLRTSCGSYAYTAPEVIKSRPYDGFKSDSWSL